MIRSSVRKPASEGDTPQNRKKDSPQKRVQESEKNGESLD